MATQHALPFPHGQSATVHTLAKNWWLTLLRGLAAIAFGIIAFGWPKLTVVTLILLFAAYVLADCFAGFISGSFYIHLGKDFDMVLGPAYASLVKGGLVLLVEWYILYWMYRRKLFLKI